MTIAIKNPNTAPQIGSKTTGETRFCAMDFGTGGTQGKLGDGETLTGTPTASVVSTNTTISTTTLTLSSVAPSTAVLKVNGRDCAIGECVQFTAADGAAGTTYTISITAATTGGGAVQTLVGFGKIRVENA